MEKQRHHQAPSLTVYAETLRRRERRNDRTTIEFLGFGDPLFAEAESSGGLPHLPSSRREVEAIAKLYEEGKTEVYLGATATEELAKATMPHARVIHFATHGLLDSVSPMDSALVLARPKPGVSEENGSLQMWEIIQDIRLTADLVVLSACETALGKERDGEGLIGLTRAFQFAGSRSTIASHWPIADDRTAALMTTLHHHLVSGLSKVDALRQTQLQALASDGEDSAPTASHPFVWASFSLFGDWQ